MVRVTLAGPELVGLESGDPGSSVRLLLPRGGDAIEVPTWNGNEFLHADGGRPRIRTLTPLGVRGSDDGAELDVDIVVHDDSPLSTWARSAVPCDAAAVSGTGSGYTVDPSVGSYVLLGDESAVPAISTLLRALPSDAPIRVVIERRADAEPVPLPDHRGAHVTWSVLDGDAPPGDTLVAAAATVDVGIDTRVWAAGEAAGVQRLRRLLLGERGLARTHATIRGYWKVGRAGT